jgi:sedoheptulose-bisphosphatase
MACFPCAGQDGSSVIGMNFAVGSIFGVWPGPGLLGRTGREQAMAMVAVYVATL